MQSKRYLISACLLGHKVRYDGQDCLLKELLQHLLPGQYVSLCPEVSGGLAIPARLPRFNLGMVTMYCYATRMLSI